MSAGLLARLAGVVAERGGAAAIEDRGAVTTYADLWRWAAAIGTWLEGQGVGVGDRVGLELGKSAGLVAAMLGCWWAGAAFIPLPPEVPRERRRAIVDEARPRLRIDDARVAALRAAAAGVASTLPPALLRGGDLAYIIYTSGSSGRPKGVMVPHRGIVSLLRAQSAAFGLGARARALFYLSPAFDAAISDIGTVLHAGATLVIAEPSEIADPRGLLRVLARDRITHADLPPALLPHLDPEALPPALETIVIGGEVCPPAVVRRIAARVRVVNVYGPTEATVCASLVACDPVAWTRPLIGAPLPGVILRVVDPAGEDAAPGAPGELLIGGIGLALGYVAEPPGGGPRFIERRGERLYRSGDQVVVLADGSIAFLGRLDRQRKLGGVRIELGEVEAALALHPGVGEAAVVDGASGGLVALVVGRGGAAPPDAAELAGHLRERLPQAAIPRRFAAAERLPRGTSGKIDPAAVARLLVEHARDVAGAGAGAGDGDGGDLRGLLAGLWRAVLGVATVADDDRFIGCGGGSLAALELVAAAEPRGITLSAADLLGDPSFAEVVAAASRAASDVRSAESIRAEVSAVIAQRGLNGLKVANFELPRVAGIAADATLLVTGATGFLGRHLVAELACRHRGPILCLVRDRDRERAQARLDQALADAAAVLGRDDGRPSAACEVVLGDLAAPGLGLAPRDRARLAAEVDAVIHSGARVHLGLGSEALAPVNLGGTAALLGLALAGRAALFHHISSLSVFVAATPALAAPRERDGLGDAEALHGGYAQSKWAAEQLVREVAPGRLPAVIHRLGLITGDLRSGRGPADDQLGLFLRGVAELGAVPAGHERLRIDVTPVCYAARGLATLILEGPPVAAAAPTTFHLASAEGASAAGLVAALRRSGAPIEVVDGAAWRELGRGLSRRSPAAAVAYLALGRCLGEPAFRRVRAYDLFQATGFRFAAPAAAAILGPRGLSCPPATPALLDRYVAAAFEGGRP